MRLRPYSLLLLLLLDDLMMMLECSLRFAEAASNPMSPPSSQCLPAVRGGGVKPDVAAFLTVLAAVRGGGTNLYVEPSSCAELLRCRVKSVHWPALCRPSLGGALDCAPSTPFTDLCLAGTCLSHSTIALRESRWCSSDCVLGLELAPTCASLAWCLGPAAQLLPSSVARSPSHLVLDRGGSLLP